jgi:hypothetical protein
MIDIPYHIVQKIAAALGEKIDKLCEWYIEDSIGNVIKQTAAEYFSGKVIAEVRPYIYKNQFQKTKKRWFQALEKNVREGKKKETELIKEVHHAEYHIDTYGTESFQQLFHVSSVDSLIEKRLKEVEAWADDPTQLVTQYFYIREKTDTQIVKAIKTDVAMTIADILLNEYKGNPNKMLTAVPFVLSEHAVYGENGKLQLSSETTVINGESYFTSEYQPDPNYSLTTIVNEKALIERKITEKHLRLLDDADFEIFQAVMSRSSVEFVGQRKIFVQVGDIVREVYKSDGKKNYETVLSRLVKMANIRFTHVDNDTAMVFGIFDYVEFDPNLNSQMVEITVNEVIHREYTEFNLIHMYSDAIAKLEVGTAKLLIFPLQKERMRCHAEHTQQTILSFEFFSHKLRFRKRSKKENIRVIEECLEEMVRHHVTVQSYKRVGNDFHIEFIPVTETEMQDLVASSKRNSPLSLLS